MVAFLAALPALFAAIKGATELFDLGKKAVEEIKGESVSVTTAQELEQEVSALPKEQQARFLELMAGELQAYQAISDRLLMQGGQMDGATLQAIEPSKRSEIAYLRMTTRPWAVRWMVGAVVFPPLALVAANLGISLYNILNAAWAQQPQALAHINLGEVMNDLYLNMVGWASGVVMTYMGMREIGKAVGHRDETSLVDVAQTFGGIFGNMKKVFK